MGWMIDCSVLSERTDRGASQESRLLAFLLLVCSFFALQNDEAVCCLLARATDQNTYCD
jgi:hypothetical protein